MSLELLEQDLVRDPDIKMILCYDMYIFVVLDVKADCVIPESV